MPTQGLLLLMIMCDNTFLGIWEGNHYKSLIMGMAIILISAYCGLFFFFFPRNNYAFKKIIFLTLFKIETS